ncbi:hypothetical protein SKAU_G00047220 [Synaphobranchus kaupii]|uniref:G-protein coupled receptors family 1 profile domain-containing protein n=1 Tax=Synaphobranchus kaupii TaxID=118154 RepID=A0A9Q1G389_SYNKA|nr:hypothetical protein SKAU_G00047220 [Synaphobranchus kaupii]
MRARLTSGDYCEQEHRQTQHCQRGIGQWRLFQVTCYGGSGGSQAIPYKVEIGSRLTSERHTLAQRNSTVERTWTSLPATMVQHYTNDTNDTNYHSLFRSLGSFPPAGLQEMLQEYANHSSEFCSQYKNAQWYCYVLLALYALALPVGILGNTAALLNYMCFRRTWTPSSVFLLNLALCDSAWMMTLPFALYFSLRRPYLKGFHTFCQFKKISFNINIYGSIFFLTLISFDRFAGAVHPISSLRWWGAERARQCSALAWVALFLWSVPDLFLAFGTERPSYAMVCMDHIRGPLPLVKAVSVARTVLGFGVPFGLMLAFYAMTVRALRSLPRGSKQRRRAAKPLVLISAAVVVFVVSFVPYHAIIVTLVVMRANRLVTVANVDTLHATYELFEALCSVSSALDPLLYILASERFQKGCRAFRRRPAGPLCCLRSRRIGAEG